MNTVALQDLKARLLNSFTYIEKMILFGSVARNESDNESDCDLLILTNQPLNRFERHKITNTIFDVNLLHDTNYSSIVIDKNAWESGPVSVLPIKNEVQRDGIDI